MLGGDLLERGLGDGDLVGGTVGAGVARSQLAGDLLSGSAVTFPAVSLADAVAREVASGRTVEEAASRLGVPVRTAHLAFKEYGRRVTLANRARAMGFKVIQTPRLSDAHAENETSADPAPKSEPTTTRDAPVPAESTSQQTEAAAAAPLAVQVTAPGKQALWCEAGGHPWERPAQRGRKPRNCPDHR